ncbi:D-arabinono-1,4-lactone oxidase-domain-containing protein [Collybia nuda]|uniref:D-arabinono-1,4-lactone oxidase n=1 Tax=Collybia nuda TaxID=64659 RepID=A0A9P6CEW9_9AGAR|nr:D-arabinono-1,4-lactone oxidase-domain-containing protein [Collybia nuda]
MSTQLTARPSDIPLQNLYELLQPITVPSSSTRASFSNWGHTFHCTPLAIFEPENEYQCELVLELARREGKVLRAVGVGHSPSDLACTNDFMLRTVKMNRVVEVNPEKRYVVAQAGITLHDLHAELDKHNLAMLNVGSISDQTLAGIVTTATHGSGIEFGVMSTHVMALTLLLADGSRVTCSRTEQPDLFTASLCGLGSTGLILHIHLEVEPAYRLKELQETLPFEEVMENLEKLVYSAEHVRFWWFPTTDTVRCSYSDRTQESKSPAGSWWWHTFLGYHVTQLLLLISRYFLFLNTWVGKYNCWLISSRTVGIDDSHLIFNVDCRYPQHTTEWAVPYQNAQACLREIRTWLQQENLDPNGIRPHVPVEIRFSAPDDIWLSPSYGQRTCWIGIVSYKPYGFNVPYRRYFGGYESIVSRHQGRPHWAKAHRLQPEILRQLYPRFDDFVRVIEDVDPRGMFRNEYVQRHVMGRPISGRFFKIRPV